MHARWQSYRRIPGQAVQAVGDHLLFSFLTTEPNKVVATVHPKAMDKTHRDAVREIAARVLAQLHGLAKRGKIQRIGRRADVSWGMLEQ